MKYKLYRPDEMSNEQWQIYAALRDARAVYDDPFFDPDFARLVGEVREDTRIGFASDRDGVFAIWPMHIRPGNWARPIGSPFSDWNGPILAEDVRLTTQEILAGFDVSGLTTQGFRARHIGEPLPLDRVGGNLSVITSDAESFLADQQALWPKHFKKMRRIYRNIARDFDKMAVNWDDRTDASFERVLELKQAQYIRTGYHNVLKAPWARALLDRLRTFEGRRLRARLVTLSFDDSFVAGEFDLQSDTILHGWITAFDQQFKAYSPGHVLMQEMLPRMCEDGLNIYDAGPGLDKYKRNYANVQVPVETGVVPGAQADLSPARIAGRAWRFTEQMMPDRASAIMARARRRMDQIAAVETSWTARAGGFLNAVSHRPI